MLSQPQKEHEWLQQLVGEWTYESECNMGPDQPPGKSTGNEKVRSFGGLWVLMEGEGTAPDGSRVTSQITIGYDPLKQRYVGSFIASVMAQMWHYEGTLEPDGKALPLNTTGPSFTDMSKLAPYKDVFEIVSADHRILRSFLQGEDGSWVPFMTAHYRRKQ